MIARMIEAGDPESHRTMIAAGLRRLGLEPDAIAGGYRLLTSGASGSIVYRITVAGEDAVLKITLPAGDPDAAARALREAHFYRDLAWRVPLRVPRLIALDVDEAEGVTILLAAYQPVPAPATWSDLDYCAIASELGRFHAAFWGSTSELDGLTWLLPPRSPVTAAECGLAAAIWRTLDESALPRELLTPRRRRMVAELLERFPALDRTPSPLPPTLCHGDCHAGNVLQAPSGERVWTDWQEVRIGYGSDDLAFFCQRALADGGRVPYPAMSHAYRTALVGAIGEPLPPEAVDSALYRSELRSWLLEWPPYLRYLSTDQLGRIFDRIDGLIDRITS